MTESITTKPTPEDARTFGWLGDAIPRYESFFRVAEHRSRDKELASTYDHVTYEELGKSEGGESLWSVTVGSGSQSALLIGAPHPNEPIGSMTIDFLLHELARNGELRSSLDYEFVCLPVADPDGVRMNEGWFDGPFTLSNYVQNFYRPPPHRQIEATFPVEHEDYSFEEPTPATRAAADLIESHRPDFVYSFHNTDFGGCYFLLTEPLDALHDVLTSLPGEYSVPLDRGEPEWFEMEAFDEAVYRLETFEDRYHSAQKTNEDASLELLGGNAYDYARQFNDDVTEFIVELPYFHAPQIEQQTELERSREAVIREGVEQRTELLREWEAAVKSTGELLPATPMTEEATGAVSHFQKAAQAKLDWAESVAETGRRATTAEYIDEQFLRQYPQLRYLGMLLRSLDNAAMDTGEQSYGRLTRTKAALNEVINERIGELQTNVNYQVIPIWKLVAIQARAGLICLDHRQNRKRT